MVRHVARGMGADAMRLAYFARWYAKDGTIREAYFERLKDARAEAKKHKDAEVYKRQPPYVHVKSK